MGRRGPYNFPDGVNNGTTAEDNFLGAYSIAWQNMFAASVVATIPVIVLFAVIERRVVTGLTAGSIK